MDNLVEDIILSEKQRLFIEDVESGKNVFLTGKAGTGKSFVVKMLPKRLCIVYKSIQGNGIMISFVSIQQFFLNINQ